MAELHAAYENKKTGVNKSWLNDLPRDQPIKIGRLPELADWAMKDDALISGLHATVTWDGTKLHVEERDPPPTNPIYFLSKKAKKFSLVPGESFVIGGTTFTFKDSRDEDGSGRNGLERTVPAELQFSRGELKEVGYYNPAQTLAALEKLPDALRYATDEVTLLEQMMGILLQALPSAMATAIVEPRADIKSSRPVSVIYPAQSTRLFNQAPFRPARKLVEKALLQQRRSVLHVWAKGLEDSTQMTVRFNATTGIPWAVCTPLDDGSGQGVYADGILPRDPHATENLLNDPELRDYQKVIELFASLIESTRRSHQFQELLSTYGRFLPKRVRAKSEPKVLEAKLQPRVAPVTVLFCDLRGSSRVAEDGEGVLEQTWHTVAKALDDITRTITDEDGIVAGFQGDAVMAFWGWPDEQADQVSRAARTALRIRELFDHRESWLHAFGCGIGIAHGKAVVGRLGARDLAKVDVFGPVANLASRLESLTKQLGTHILVDQAAAEALNATPSGRVAWRTRTLARFRPVGMTADTRVSELLPPADDLSAKFTEKTLRVWEEAVALFLAGEWDQAKQRLSVQFARDPVGKILLEHMACYDGTPPVDWDGVIGLEVK
ncbi:MAG TPA: adenylate/guanylate cyclase domain-containing protein [Fimbriiglobus sp.]